MSPVVSVIVPVYNTERFLRRCLDSVCGQTLKNIEILCVDDASTDGSAAILDEYASRDPRIRVLSFSKNRGAAAARNAGIDAALGEYLGFVDSDDFLDAGFYETLTALNGDVAIANIVEERDDGADGPAGSMNSRIYLEVRRNALRCRTGFTGIFPIAVYRTKMIRARAIRFAEERTICEDRMFPLLARFYAGTVRGTDDVFYHYRWWNGSATRRGMSRRDAQGFLAFFEDVADFMRHASLTESEGRLLANKLIYEAACCPALELLDVETVCRVVDGFFGEVRDVCDFSRTSVSAIIESLRTGRGRVATIARMKVDVARANARRAIHGT